MERLTRKWPEGSGSITGRAICEFNHCPEGAGCNECVYGRKNNRLATIEDILGDDYDLKRLRELVEADRDGRLYGYSGYKIAIASDVSNGTVCKLVRDLGIAEELEERRKTITPEEREAQKQRLLLLVGETTKAPEATEKQAEPPKEKERPPIFHLETVLQPSAAGAWFSGLSMALRGMPDGELVRITVTVEVDLK